MSGSFEGPRGEEWGGSSDGSIKPYTLLETREGEHDGSIKSYTHHIPERGDEEERSRKWGGERGVRRRGERGVRRLFCGQAPSWTRLKVFAKQETSRCQRAGDNLIIWAPKIQRRMVVETVEALLAELRQSEKWRQSLCGCCWVLVWGCFRCEC